VRWSLRVGPAVPVVPRCRNTALHCLQQAAGTFEHERHLLAAYVGIGDDDVTVLTAAEHQALALQAHPEHLPTPAAALTGELPPVRQVRLLEKPAVG
jgi:hypothetical protein